MGKRLGVLGAAVALVALAVGVVPAWGSSGDDARRATFRVLAETSELNSREPPLVTRSCSPTGC